MEAVRFENLSFQYPNKDSLALKNLSFKVKESEFVLICGKSGCGKSTLLRHLKKNLIPYGNQEGKVFYFGENIETLDDRTNASQVGFVRQDPDNQIVTDKVWHELAFVLESLGYKNSEIKRRVAEMASFFGIHNWFQKNTSDLSGGQKQLLNLASVMVMQPKLLVLDEPTSQLDPISASEFINTLKKINQEFGTTIVISEHRLEELFPIADRVMVMSQGEIEVYDTPKNVAKMLSREEDKSDMFYALPNIMQIYALCTEENDFPLTIREGKNWVKKTLDGNFVTKKFEQTIKNDNTKAEEKLDLKIDIKDLYFKYEKNSPNILDGLNLQVRKGETFALLGGNGTGKSTLLKSICAVIKPQSGSIKIDDKDLKKIEKELFVNNVALLPQNPQSIFTEITAEEEILEGLHYSKISDKEKVDKVNQMLKLLDLESVRKSNPYDLSGGEQQRLALGKVLMLEPKILLLDEPSKGIDSFFKRKLGQILKTLNDKGITILLVSHDIEFCARYSDRCGMFFNGEVVSIGTPVEFFSGNSFYTTSSNKMVREWYKTAILPEEVSAWIKTQL